MSALDGRRSGALEVSVRHVVQTRWGETIGLIVGVWRNGFYQGSYFEQVRRVPRASDCRPMGVNHAYSSQLKR